MTLLLIDGDNLLFRAWFGAAKSGTPALTIRIFLQVVLRLLGEFKASHAAMVLDTEQGAEPRRRMIEVFNAGLPAEQKVLPGYKSGRHPRPAEFLREREHAAQLMRLLGVQVLESTLGEADDVIATLASAVPTDAEVVVASNDKDLTPLLVRRGTCLAIYHEGGRERVVQRFDAEQTYGFPVERFPDWLALVGDTTDCVPGVPDVGRIWATRIMTSFDSLEAVYANMYKVGYLARGGARVAEQLLRHRHLAMLSRRLVRLEQVPNLPELDALVRQPVEDCELVAFAQDLQRSERVNLVDVVCRGLTSCP